MCTSASTAWRATSAGRLEQRADVDVEAEVGERGGDHLLAAVVAVLAHLGDQDARPAALRLGERVDDPARFLHVGHAADLLRVHAGDRTDLRRSAGRTPSPAPRRSRRRSPSRGRRRWRARAGCPSPSAAAVSASQGARRRRPRRAPRRSRRSFASCCARTAALSTFSTSIVLVGVGEPVLVDADHRLAAGVDARLGAGGGLLDAQLRDAGLDRLGHAAGASTSWMCAHALRARS